MAIRAGRFYPVFPILDGTPMSRQWGLSRSNTAELKAIARNSYQELEDDVDELNALRALIGQAYGDLDFRNKYRIYYESSTEELTIQKNDGTVASPSWTDMVQFRNHDGQLQAVGSGGIYSAAGFYPEPRSLGEVAESGSDADTSITNVTKLFFDTDAGLTVTRIPSGANAGHPEISVDRPFGQAQNFEKRGRVWEVNHNYGITPVLAQVMDSNYRVIIPDKADFSDPNTAYFYFNEVVAGYVYIASGGVGAASLAPRDPFYLVMRTDEQNAADNTMKVNADLIFDSDYFYINVDLDSDAAGAHKTAHISLTGTVTDDSEYAFRDGSRSFTDHVDFDDSVYVENAVTAEAFYTKANGEIAPLTIEESDGDPSISNVNKIVVTGTGILTDDGGGQVTLVASGLATDHGTLAGLTDDDHTQYALADGSRNFSAHVNFDDTIYVENAITAEAFYTKSNGFAITETDLSLKNVKHYGAVGDGVTDDTTPIQNAINAANAETYGATVFFPAGTYNVSGLTAASNMHICGIGSNTTTLFLIASSDADIISIPDETTHLKISNLSFDGNYSNNASGDGINIGGSGATGSSHIEVCYCRFIDIKDAAINSGEGLTNIHIHDNYIDGTDTSFGIVLAAGDDMCYNIRCIRNVVLNTYGAHIQITGIVTNCQIVGNYLDTTSVGDNIAGYNADNVDWLISNNCCKNAGNNGMHVAGDRIVISDNIVYNPTYHGVYISSHDSPPTICNGCCITGNTIEDTPYCGINIVNAKGVVISNNSVNIAGQQGILSTVDTTANACDYATITGNRITGTTQDGIRLIGGINYSTVTGNTVDDVRNGIALTTASTANNSNIIGLNNINTTTQYGILETTAATGNIYFGNRLENVTWGKVSALSGSRQWFNYPKEDLSVQGTIQAEAFYLTSDGEIPISYVEEFSSAVEWVVNHNLNRKHFIAQAFKGTGEMLTPDAVYVNDASIAYFYFGAAHAGKAVIFGVG